MIDLERSKITKKIDKCLQTSPNLLIFPKNDKCLQTTPIVFSDRGQKAISFFNSGEIDKVFLVNIRLMI